MHTRCVRGLTIDAVVIGFVVCDSRGCDDGVMKCPGTVRGRTL